MIKGHITELTTLRNRLAHGDTVFDVSTGRLHFVFRKGEYTVSAESKSEIDSRVKAVDDFLNILLADPHFS